jgi:hypothetical protein
MADQTNVKRTQETNNTNGKYYCIKIESIPTEVWTHIFHHVTLKEIKTLSSVCKHFYTILDTNSIWKPIAFQLWKGKQMGLELFKNTNYSQLIPQLSMKEIKRLLILRNQYIKDLIEKKEFVELLKKSDPIGMPILCCNKWKASYICSIIDSRRTQITKAELCSKNWTFRFKQWGPDHPGIVARFKADYTYESEMFEQVLHWRFYCGNIQVEQYPEITCTRTSDWGWEMENPMVYYVEKKSL